MNRNDQAGQAAQPESGGDVSRFLAVQEFESEARRCLPRARYGVPFVLSSNGTVPIEELTAIPGVRCWFQLYVQGDRGFTRDSITRVEAAGCEAVCVTVDTPVLGLRPRQLRAGFRVPAGVELPHAARRREASDPGLHSAVTWRDVDWLRSVVKNKLLLKGVLHPADAELAVQAGADGVARCLSLLIEELRLAMALIGAGSLQDLNREVEWPAPAVARSSP